MTKLRKCFLLLPLSSLDHNHPLPKIPLEDVFNADLIPMDQTRDMYVLRLPQGFGPPLRAFIWVPMATVKAGQEYPSLDLQDPLKTLFQELLEPA